MGYFDAIGVESELVMLTTPESGAANSADTHEWHLPSGGYMELVLGYGNLIWRIGSVNQNIGSWSYNKAKDPRMDALYNSAKETIDVEEYKGISRQADEITVREHWGLNKSNSPTFAVSQPWVQGYFGEAGMGWGERNTHLARIWIDSELKKAKGH